MFRKGALETIHIGQISSLPNGSIICKTDGSMDEAAWQNAKLTAAWTAAKISGYCGKEATKRQMDSLATGSISRGQQDSIRYQL